MNYTPVSVPAVRKNSKSKKKKWLIALISLVCAILLTVGAFAYYEFYGQYASVLTVKGTIRLDAFDVLYPALRGDPSYGCTPENPYVIDSYVRLQNLIKLNNSGKLAKAKKEGQQFYFCLQFDEQTLPQLLDLSGKGPFSPIGNNENPFVDELSGIVYGYEITGGNIVFLSGCLPKVHVEVDIPNNCVSINGELDDTLTPGDFPDGDGTYVKLERNYDADVFSPGNTESVVFGSTVTKDAPQYINVERLVVCHQMIANETISVSDEQLDVGFISSIGKGGNVHDVILYGTTIRCTEPSENFLQTLFKGLFGGDSTAVQNHKFAKSDKSDERHIGFFAGHIDKGGAASNISVAGISDIDVKTRGVNYFSEYTTVGYIDENAIIGDLVFSKISVDSFLEGGSAAGCMFADNIYQSVTQGSDSTADGALHFQLKKIEAKPAAYWPGAADSTFSYGSFMFLMSAENDTVSTIWNNSTDLRLLAKEGYSITGSVLYCADEYRYSDDAPGAGGLVQIEASVKEVLYSGISSLKATGSVIDAGKYLICAKVADSNETGGYAYYAVKLIADQNASGTVSYKFDSSSACNVTAFITDTTGNEQLRQSALWEVSAASKTPTFENCRFENNYLTHPENNLGFGDTASTFEYSSGSNSFYYMDGDVQHFLNFDANAKTFSFSTDANTDIVIYRISSGYILEPVTERSGIELYGDYVMAARSGVNSYLLGIGKNGSGVVDGSFAADKQLTTAEFPTTVSVEEYEEYLPYIWSFDSLVEESGTPVVHIVDKSTGGFYAATAGDGSLRYATTAGNWTVAQSGGGWSFRNNGEKYLSYTAPAGDAVTGFTTANSAYPVYLYRLVPQDDTPLYITYEGAQYLDADASTVEAGDYAIVGMVGGNTYALGMSNTTAMATEGLLVNVGNANAITDQSYLWHVETASASPIFQNKANSTRYLANSTTLSTGIATTQNWMYDASTYRFYYDNGGTRYYLVIDSSHNFAVKTANQSDYSYEIRLYKVKTQYTLNGVSISQLANVNPIPYSLANAGTNKVLVVTNGTTYQIIRRRTNSTATDTVNATYNAANGTLTTTTDISGYHATITTNGDGVYVQTNDGRLSGITATTGTVTWATTGNTTLHYDNNVGFYTGNTVPNNPTYKVFLYTYTTSSNTRTLTKVTPTSYMEGYFLVSYADLSNTAKSQYVVGYRKNSDQNIIDSKDLTGKYTFTGNSLVTTENLSDYLWKFTSDGNFGYFFNYGYHPTGTGTANTDLFLSADNNAGSRQFGVTNKKQGGVSSDDESGFYINIDRTNSYQGTRIAFQGTQAQYYLVDQTVEGQFNLERIGNRTATNIVASASTEAAPFIYYATGMTTGMVLDLVSSDGEALDKNIHYTIAAEVSVGGSKHYVALAMENADGMTAFTGIDMTSQYEFVMQAGAKYSNNINVPRSADWTQRTDTVELYFYHTLSSTNATQVYLDVAGDHSLTEEPLSSKENFTQSVNAFYYDPINKLFKTIIDSTPYYLTYSNTTGLFSLTQTAGEAAPIHLLRYSPTYNVELVTSFGELDAPTLKDGDFIFAGHTAKGYTAIGTDGASLDLDFDVTHYLGDKLSEEDYREILEYVFRQVYYEYDESADYGGNDDNLNSYVIMQLFTEANTGSFAGIRNNNANTLQPNASAQRWRVTRTADGKWKLVNDEAIGNTGANSIGVTFSGNAAASLTVKDPNKAIDDYFGGGYQFSAAFDSNGSNIYLYSTAGEKLASAPVSGSSYLLVAETNGFTVAIGNNGGTVEPAPFDSSTVGTLDGSKYHWEVTTSGEGYAIANNGRYAVFDNGFALSSTKPEGSFVQNPGGVLSYQKTTTETYRPTSTGNKAYGVSPDSQYTAFLYTYTTSSSWGTTYTLRKATTPTDSGNKVLVMSDGTTNYAIRLNSSRLQLSESGDTLTHSSNRTTTFDNYRVTVTESGGKYSIYNNSQYLTVSATAASASTTQTYLDYNDEVGFHYAVPTTTTANCELIASAHFQAVDGLDGDNPGSKVILYKYEGAVPSGSVTAYKEGINTGDQYAVVFMESGHYYMLGNSNGHITASDVTTQNGTVLSDSDLLLRITNANLFSAVASDEFGHKLQSVADSTKYLSVVDGDDKLITVGSTQTCWEYHFDEVYLDNSRLYTVIKNAAVAKVLSVVGNAVIPVSNGAETYLYSVTGSAGSFKLGSLSGSLTAGTNYAIIIYQEGRYYLVTRVNGTNTVVPTSFGSALPTDLTNDMIWTVGGSTDNYFFRPYNDNDYYLRVGENAFLTLLDNTTNCTWAYTSSNTNSTNTFGAGSNTQATPINIFKVSMSNELDQVSDTYTTLQGKTIVQSSLSVLDSTNYIITATHGGKTYVLSMKDVDTSETLDVTDTFNEALEGGKIRLFNTAVWNQIGHDYSLIFDNAGFGKAKISDPPGEEPAEPQEPEGGEEPTLTSYLLSPIANTEALEGSTPIMKIPTVPEEGDPDLTPYTWTFYPQSATAYVIGYNNTATQEIAYIYFDASDLTFKLTKNKATAQDNPINIYQLGQSISGEINFQTLEISLKEDGVTIESYPINETDAKDVKKYENQSSGTDQKNITGEYMVAARVGNKYYAVIPNAKGEISTSDITPLFSGNFLIDTNGNYCISVNTKYLWKQTASGFTYNGNTGEVSGIQLQNFVGGNPLEINEETSLTFGNGQLHAGTYYLNFSEQEGFTVETHPSDVEIILYSVGASGIVFGSDEPQYSYYSYSLDSDVLDYTLFTFEKKQIPDLPNYVISEDGIISSQKSWKLTGSTDLEEVHNSVYFSEGVDINKSFKEIEDSFELTDPENGNTTGYDVTYYVPAGTVSFLIPEASSDSPAFINVIVSTELDSSFDADTLRFLSMWKLANLDIQGNTATLVDKNGNTMTAADFKTVLAGKLQTPDAAIPLPNHLSTRTDPSQSASIIKVREETGGTDGEGNPIYETNRYNLADLDGNHMNYNHLIAHTFTVTQPGVYSIGSNYGTVAFCYVSVDKMLKEEENEDNENQISDSLTIDFVWGEMADSAVNGDDSVIGTIAYVGRTETVEKNGDQVVDPTRTWVHSNVYPRFTNGTAGFNKPGDGNTSVSAPTDEFKVEVRRTYHNGEDAESTEDDYSMLSVNVTTTNTIYNETHKGFKYSNMNTASQRKKRRVDFHVNGLTDDEDNGGEETP